MQVSKNLFHLFIQEYCVDTIFFKLVLVVADIRFGLIEMMQQFIDMASDLGIFCRHRERQAPIEIPRLPDILIMAANSLFQIA